MGTLNQKEKWRGKDVLLDGHGNVCECVSLLCFTEADKRAGNAKRERHPVEAGVRLVGQERRGLKNKITAVFII